MTYFPTLPYTAYYMQEGAKKSSLRQSVCFLPVTGPRINLDEKKMPRIPMALAPHVFGRRHLTVKLTCFIFTFLFFIHKYSDVHTFPFPMVLLKKACGILKFHYKNIHGARLRRERI